MSGRSVPNLAAVDPLDRGEIMEGYWDGSHGEPEPGDNRSLAYWQGWRNGAVDGGHREKDAEQAEIAREHVAAMRGDAP